MEILYEKLDHQAKEPRMAHFDEDAGWDLFALEDTYIPLDHIVDLRSGIAVAIPTGYYGRICSRSSTFRKRGLVVVEGVIDSGFRGELFSTVWNPGLYAPGRAGTPEGRLYGKRDVQIMAGESIAQLIITPVPPTTMREVTTLPISQRGILGFGSSDRVDLPVAVPHRED